MDAVEMVWCLLSMLMGGGWPAMETDMVVGSRCLDMETAMVVGCYGCAMGNAMVVERCCFAVDKDMG